MSAAASSSNTDSPVSEEIAAKAEAIKNEANEKFQKVSRRGYLVLIGYNCCYFCGKMEKHNLIT